LYLETSRVGSFYVSDPLKLRKTPYWY